MLRFILLRASRAVFTMWLVMTVVFAVLRVSGDPAEIMMGPDASQAALDAFRSRNGFDQPLVVQYLGYLTSIFKGDLGQSLLYHRPVIELFAQRLPATLELALAAILIAVVIGIPVGILAALKQNTLFDRGSVFLAVAGQAAPGFFIGIILILVLSLNLHWLPSSGRGSLNQIIMPAITLATGLLAGLARMTRSSVLEVKRADYIRTARAKGLREPKVITSHLLRNAALPVLTMAGMWISGLLGGAAVTETVFAWPGMGRLIVEAVSSRDYATVQSVVLIVTATVVTVNMLVDITYGVIDPRISIRGK